MEGLAVFLINLDGSDARLASAGAALRGAGLEFRRLAAFDGRGKPPGALPGHDAALARRRFGRALTGAEVGCALSHLDAARQFLATDHPFALVCEDDVTAVPGAAPALAAILQAIGARPDWVVANLGQPATRCFTPVATVGPGRLLVRAHYFPVTTTALLWTRAGAARFVAEALPIVMPVDHFLRQWVTRAGSGYAVNPPLFPPGRGPSEIDAAGPRRRGRRGLRYGMLKQIRLWTNRARAARHRTAWRAAHPRSGPPG